MLGDFITLVRIELDGLKRKMKTLGVVVHFEAEIHLDPAPILASEYRFTDTTPDDTLIVTAKFRDKKGDIQTIDVSVGVGDVYHLPIEMQKRIIKALVLDNITYRIPAITADIEKMAVLMMQEISERINE